MAENPATSLISWSSLFQGSMGGMLHAGVAVVLWDYFGFDNLGELLLAKPLTGLYILVGMFVLGFVPALCYAGRRFIAPAVVVGGLLLLSTAASWVSGTVRAPAGTPTPFGFYILLWIGVVALAGVLGGIEYTWKRPDTG